METQQHDRIDENRPLPASLLACLPVLWSRVLFPGPSTGNCAEPIRIRALLILLFLPGLLLYPCLSFRLFEPDEGRYAEIPREMSLRGEWVVPYLQAKPYLDKPPLLYWMVMASYRVFGIHDWSARLIPALVLHGCILITYLLGRRRVGERAAFWGALALGLAPGFMTMGRLLILDGVLTLCVTLALFCAYEALGGPRLAWGWWLLTAVACGLGVLTKGPIALILTLPPVLAIRWLQGSSQRIGWRASLVFAVTVLAVTLPWYIAICVRMPTFAVYFLWEHNVVRFLSPFDHIRPIWFYLPVLACGLLPATLLLPSFLRFLLTSDPETVRRRSPELGFLLLAGGWCLLFFSLSGSKLPTYVLPAFPPLALALGCYLTGSRWQQSRCLTASVAAGFSVLAIAHYAVLPWYAHFHSPMSNAEEVSRRCADAGTPVICYPRPCDSVGFYLGRDDLINYRSKDTPELVQFLLRQPRAVILFTHRHSLESLREVLPPQLRLTREAPLSGSLRSLLKPETCYMADVVRE